MTDDGNDNRGNGGREAPPGRSSVSIGGWCRLPTELMEGQGANEPDDRRRGLDLPDRRLLQPGRGPQAGRPGQQRREKRNPEKAESVLHASNLARPTGDGYPAAPAPMSVGL